MLICLHEQKSDTGWWWAYPIAGFSIEASTIFHQYCCITGQWEAVSGHLFWMTTVTEVTCPLTRVHFVKSRPASLTVTRSALWWSNN